VRDNLRARAAIEPRIDIDGKKLKVNRRPAS